jgi:hypothetical protein
MSQVTPQVFVVTLRVVTSFTLPSLRTKIAL